MIRHRLGAAVTTDSPWPGYGLENKSSLLLQTIRASVAFLAQGGFAAAAVI